jgi:hypothetical protein
MIGLGSLCDAIVQTLVSCSIGVPVEHFPSDQNPKPRHAHGTVFVRFESLSAVSLGNTRMSNATKAFSVFATAKDLSGPASALALLERVIEILHGRAVRIEGGRQEILTLTTVDLTVTDNGFWVYQAQFVAIAPILSGNT